MSSGAGQLTQDEFYERATKVLSLLTVVASDPDPERVFDPNNGAHGAKRLLQELWAPRPTSPELVTESLALIKFLETHWSVSRLHPINALDALLRHGAIKDFFHEQLGLEEAFLFYVDADGKARQLWLEARKWSIAFPEKDRCINCKRLQSMAKRYCNKQSVLNLLTQACETIRTKHAAKWDTSLTGIGDECLFVAFVKRVYGVLNSMDVSLIQDCTSEKVDQNARRLPRYYAREVLAEYLIKKNEWLNRERKVVGHLGDIPLFRVLGGKCSKRTPLEKNHLIALVAEEEMWHYVTRYRRLLLNQIGECGSTGESQGNPQRNGLPDLSRIEEEKDFYRGEIFDVLPFDPFVLDALLAHQENSSSRDLWYFNIPIDPVHVDHAERREGGAVWSGFVRTGHQSDLGRKIPVLRAALTIIGQPVVRKHLEIEIEQMAEHEARSKLYETIASPLTTLLTHLSKAEETGLSIKRAVEPPGILVLGAAQSKLQRYFEDRDEAFYFGPIQLTPQHDWEAAKDNMCMGLVGTAVLTTLGITGAHFSTETEIWERAECELDVEAFDEQSRAIRRSLRYALLGQDKFNVPEHEDIFDRAKHCFHTPCKPGGVFGLATLVACFPDAYASLCAGNIDWAVKYKFKSHRGRHLSASRKLNAMVRLAEYAIGVVTVQFSAPTAGVRRPVDGSLTITFGYRACPFEQANTNALLEEYSAAKCIDVLGGATAYLVEFFGESQNLGEYRDGVVVGLKLQDGLDMISWDEGQKILSIVCAIIK